MLKFIIWTVVLYFLFRFIINFVVPVVRASKQMKNQFRDIQEKMNAQNAGRAGGQAEPPPQKTTQKPKKEDYIEFEEIKK